MENKRQTSKTILEQMDKGIFFWTKAISQYQSIYKKFKPGDYCLVFTEKTGKYDWPTAVVIDVLRAEMA